MELGNIDWMLALPWLLAGVGIGALGYHLLNGGARSAQKLRKRLAERDRELTELRSHLNDHFSRAGSLLDSLHSTTQALQQELQESATQLGSTQPSTPDLSQADDAQEDVDAPRDYADGNRGTLSEDFGLKSRDATPAQPPRY